MMDDSRIGELPMADGSIPQAQSESIQHSEGLDVELDSVAIRRLVEEVRADEADVSRSYNRTFNRHNR
jgi:hypothetical protein